MISAKVIADSVGPNNVRIITFVLTYPRFAHAEVMTHRAFSRNASSSRAIPVAKQIAMVAQVPAVPLAFSRNKPGMQGGEALTGDEEKEAIRIWMAAKSHAVQFAEQLAALGVHKQYANRLLEPFAHISVVLTATDFDNFYALRWHKDALPEMQVLAKAMWTAQSESKPRQLRPGMMHLPFLTDGEYIDHLLTIPPWLLNRASSEPVPGGYDALWEAWLPAIQKSVARCARVSYMKHDGTAPSAGEDEGLYAKLAASEPLHASPAEHQAMCMGHNELERSGNFLGWNQFRKKLPNECVSLFTPPEE